MSNIEPQSPTNRGKPKALRVLYVEDSHLDAELSLRELKKAGFEITVDRVETPEEFFHCLRSKTYDIVLSDQNLPTWTGLEALESLRQEDKDIPFILVTGSLGEEAAVESIKKGASDYVLKGALPRLHVAVERALEDRIQRQEQLQGAEEVRRSEEKYRELFDNANDMIYTVDSEGRFTSLNKEGERILGVPRTEVIGKPFREFMAPGTTPDASLGFEEILQREPSFAVEKELLSVDGRRVTVEIRHQAIYQDGKLVRAEGIARDVTNRKQLELQLLQSQKMEGIGRLAGGVAHDFNNHLGIILGYSEMLIEKLGSDHPLRKRAETIRATAQKAAALTKQLLAFSRRQIFEPRIVDLNAEVLELEKMLQPLIGEDVELVTTLDSAIGKVRVDATQIHQVLMNLAVNARDAMPQGGRLIIETKNAELDEAYARGHIAVQPGRYAMLAVSDTGTGIDKETQDHIFEPFFTTKEKGKGTGLGLAMVYGIVKQSGGNIWVYSEKGQGTTFKIYLPRIEQDDQTSEKEETASSIHKGSEIVMVAEDEPLLQELTGEFLTDSGYKVLTAGNGAEAIEIAKRHSGPIHLLITDAIMPGMSGRELAIQMLNLRPDIKVLYVSGYTDDAVLRNGMVGTEMDFLQKPFTRDQLIRKVREVLGVDECQTNG